MAEKKMYFGTRERMTWVNCPAINTDLSKGRWSSSGQFLNGGAYIRNSVTGNKRYQFAWNMASSDEIREILDYADGVYGNDLVYFLDPFAVAKNLLPSWWATPRLQNEDAPPLTKGKRPTLVDTPPNDYSYPTKSAVFTLNGGERDSVYIPLPEGYEFHFGAHGSATGSAGVAVIPDGSSLNPVPHIVTNYVPNPRPTSTSGWTSGATVTSTLVTDGGEPAIEVASTASGTPYVYAGAVNITPVPALGKWIALGVDVKPLSSASAVAMRLLVRTQSGSTNLDSSYGAATGTADVWQRQVHAIQVVTPGADNVDAFVWPNTLAAGTHYRTRRAVLVYADTEAEARSVAATYFDGATPNTPDTTYAWTGSANASASTATTLTYPHVVDLLPENTSELTNTVVSGTTGVTITAQGSGQLTLSGMVAQALPVGSEPPTGRFISGQGHSGCRFDMSSVSVSGYSSPQALDKQAASATLIEVGAWEGDL